MEKPVLLVESDIPIAPPALSPVAVIVPFTTAVTDVVILDLLNPNAPPT